MERDPVCGMDVDPNKAAAKAEHAGKTYYFCTLGCAKRFQQAPEKYLQPDLQPAKNVPAPSGLVNLHASPRSFAGGPAVAPAAKQETHKAPELPVTEAGHHAATEEASAGERQIRYTCPMHPQIVQIGPGSCPICGMVLEPMDVFAEVEGDPEYE